MAELFKVFILSAFFAGVHPASAAGGTCPQAQKDVREKCLAPARKQTTGPGPAITSVRDAPSQAASLSGAFAERNARLSRTCETLSRSCRELCATAGKTRVCDDGDREAERLRRGAQSLSGQQQDGNQTSEGAQDKNKQADSGGGGMPPMTPPEKKTEEEKPPCQLSVAPAGERMPSTEGCSSADIAAYEKRLRQRKEELAKLARKGGPAPVGSVNRPALTASGEENYLNNPQIAKMILEQKDGNQFMFSVEQRKHVIKRMIASHQFCEAGEEIKALQQSDSEGQQAAFELGVDLDRELEKDDRPPGEFGLSLLCER